MGSFLIILALLFSLIIAIIAVANNQPVNVNYLFGEAQISLIILIIGAAAAGALVMGLISLYRGIRTALLMRSGRKQQEDLKRRLLALEGEKNALQQEIAQLQASAEAAEGEGGEAS